jgi:hypothetical protein
LNRRSRRQFWWRSRFDAGAWKIVAPDELNEMLVIDYLRFGDSDCQFASHRTIQT